MIKEKTGEVKYEEKNGVSDVRRWELTDRPSKPLISIQRRTVDYRTIQQMFLEESDKHRI